MKRSTEKVHKWNGARSHKIGFGPGLGGFELGGLGLEVGGLEKPDSDLNFESKSGDSSTDE